MSVKTSFSNLCTALKAVLSKKLDTSGGTLTGELTTQDVNIAGAVSQRSVYSRKILGKFILGATYGDLDSKYKDGTYHRMWRIRLASNTNFAGRIKVCLRASWNSFNASGSMSKTMHCGISGSRISNNVGYYDSLGYYTELDFHISELIWNDTATAWEILIWQKNLSGNNEPIVMLETFGDVLNVTVQPVELTQMTSYTAPKASPTGGDKVVNWADTPVFETPYGKEVATTDLATTSANGLMSKDDKKKLDNDVYTKTDVDNKYFMTGLRGLNLAGSTDLNDITSPGVYHILSGNVAKTFLNTPGLLVENCRLEVFFSTGTVSSNTYLIQRLCQNAVGIMYVWIRGMTTAGTWSPWHLQNGNDFTNYNYDDANITDKYIKLATYKIPESNYIDCHMEFNIYNNMGTSRNDANNSVGILNCHIRIDTNFTTPKYITATWISKGTLINTDDWFVTYNSTTKEFSLWKKIASKYESYNVQLISSSNRGIIGNAHNAVTMYYLKYTEDTYTAADYASIVTSTTCDSTAATKADIAKIQDRISDTGWVEVDFPENTNFDPASHLQYRRCGNIVSFWGEFKIMSNEDSSIYMSLIFKNLPKEDVVPEWLSSDRFTDSNPSTYVAEQRDPQMWKPNVWEQVRVYRNGWVQIDFRTFSEEPLTTGRVHTLNVTYML